MKTVHTTGPSVLKSLLDRADPESVERYHTIEAAMLILRTEAARRGLTMVEAMEGLGIVTAADLKLQNDLELYDVVMRSDPAEMRDICRRSPYAKELLRIYRTAEYDRLMAKPVALRKVA